MSRRTTLVRNRIRVHHAWNINEIHMKIIRLYHFLTYDMPPNTSSALWAMDVKPQIPKSKWLKNVIFLIQSLMQTNTFWVPVSHGPVLTAKKLRNPRLSAQPAPSSLTWANLLTHNPYYIEIH